MTGLEVYAVLKFWIPIVTAVGLIIKAFTTIAKRLRTWGDAIVGNHLVHLQEATERASAAVVELAEYHKSTLDTQHEIVAHIGNLRQDFHDHCRDDQRVQSQILTGIEVLKEQRN